MRRSELADFGFDIGCACVAHSLLLVHIIESITHLGCTTARVFEAEVSVFRSRKTTGTTEMGSASNVFKLSSYLVKGVHELGPRIKFTSVYTGLKTYAYCDSLLVRNKIKMIMIR